MPTREKEEIFTKKDEFEVSGESLGQIRLSKKSPAKVASQEPVMEYAKEKASVRAGEKTENESVNEAWIDIPITKEKLEQTFKDMGITDKTGYEITGYRGEIEGLSKVIMGNSSLDEVNFLASRLEAVSKESPQNLEVIKTAIAVGEHAKDLKDVINLTYNTGCYDLNRDILTPAELARATALERDSSTLPNLETQEGYAQAEQLGVNVSKEENGNFTKNGYFKPTMVDFEEKYKGNYKDIPKNLRVDPLYKKKHPEFRRDEKKPLADKVKEYAEAARKANSERTSPEKSHERGKEEKDR